MNTSPPSQRQRRGIYLLPNLFTTAGLFAGFYGIMASMQGHFARAAVAVFLAMILDALDGRVARMTHTESAFGGEYDSMADIVSFGVAPALIMYNYALFQLGKAGWLVAFIYVAASALRLARFNTQLKMIDKRYFQGLATPAGAGNVVGSVWLAYDMGWRQDALAYVFLAFTFLVSTLMVSNIRYHSFKEVDFKGRISFVALLLVVLVMVGIALNPPGVLFLLFFTYGLSGVVWTVWNIRQRRGLRKKKKKERK